MSLVIHATYIYAFLVFVFQIACRLTIAQLTTFDLVVVLIISEATQAALVEPDFSAAVIAKERA